MYSVFFGCDSCEKENYKYLLYKQHFSAQHIQQVWFGLYSLIFFFLNANAITNRVHNFPVFVTKRISLSVANVILRF